MALVARYGKSIGIYETKAGHFIIKESDPLLNRKTRHVDSCVWAARFRSVRHAIRVAEEEIGKREIEVVNQPLNLLPEDRDIFC